MTSVLPGHLPTVEGHFLRDNVPMDAPITMMAFARPLEIMQYQVGVGDYARCVADNACAPAQNPSLDGTPVTGVSYQDAIDYATCMSATTNETWTLPTDAECAYAAAERFGR